VNNELKVLLAGIISSWALCLCLVADGRAGAKAESGPSIDETVAYLNKMLDSDYAIKTDKIQPGHIFYDSSTGTVWYADWFSGHGFEFSSAPVQSLVFFEVNPEGLKIECATEAKCWQHYRVRNGGTSGMDFSPAQARAYLLESRGRPSDTIFYVSSGLVWLSTNGDIDGNSRFERAMNHLIQLGKNQISGGRSADPFAK
jgi:hypothetical protein